MAKNIQVTTRAAYIDQWLKLRTPLTLRNIENVQVKFKGDSVGTLFIDRLEAKTSEYVTKSLAVEKITKVMTRNNIAQTVELGDRFPNIVDAINEKTKAGELSISIATRGGV